MYAPTTKERVVSKVPLMLHRRSEYEKALPFMSVKRNRKEKEIKNNRSTQPEDQMTKGRAQFSQEPDTQKGCKNLVVKVKRLRLEKQENTLKYYNNGHISSQVSVISGSENAVALQDQCAFNLCENFKSNKKAAVKLKRIKPQNSVRPLTTASLIEKNRCSNTYQELNPVPKNLNTQLKISIKKAVVKLKRIKPHRTIRSPTTNGLPTDNSKPQAKTPIKRAIVKLKHCKFQNTRPLTITDPAKDNEQLELLRIQDLLQIKKTSAPKMKTRFSGTKRVKTAFKEPAVRLKTKINGETSAKDRTIPKQNELLKDLVITPQRRSNLKKLSLTMSSRNRKIIDTDKNETLKLDKKDEDMKERKYWTRERLTNKPELIEQLLFSETDEDDENCSKEAENAAENQTKLNKNKTHKFFHRTPEKNLPSKKAPHEQENIFEFLSQSDTSGSEKGKNKDPAADVIQKLISEGKVRVAVNQKGKGRPIVKRGRPKNERKKQHIKATVSTKINNKKNTSTTTNKSIDNEGHNNNNQGDTSYVPVPEFFDNDHDATTYFNDEAEAEADKPVSEGGFSRLARSVLLQQTKKYENTHKKDLAEQRRLLELARKFVSTPASNRKSGNPPPADLSPIQTLGSHDRPVCPSPWRIDDDSHLPRVFNFNKNTSYLPTFSSDYIPSTPKKDKPSAPSYVQFDRSASTAQENLAKVPRSIFESDSTNTLQSSLGSRNDSNEENKPPPESTPARTSKNNDENSDIFNMRQLPNPRRTLEHRSPLKDINIIEVVTLPPWKNPVNNDVQKEPSNAPIYCDSGKDDETHKTVDLFGFEEFLDPNSEDDEPSNKNNVTVMKKQSVKRNLHKKLKELKKWRPKNYVQDKANVQIKHSRLFDDDEGRPKQRLINEMLSSTMINENKKNHTEQEESNEKNTALNREQQNAQQPDFFNDYEPDTTLEKKPPRTYARSIKKKRKSRKYFILFSDIETSNSESDGEQHERKKRDNKKKRQETGDNAKQNHELESFVNEFNNMCKEVETYELLVE